MEHTHHTPRRNYGVDLLRVIAAFYVIVLHILGQGGILRSTVVGSYQWLICRSLFMWALCAVNIFGLISGYVGYTPEARPFHYKAYLKMWLEVVFYGVVLTLLTMWLCPGYASPKDLIAMFFPLVRNAHWYFSAYTCLFFLAPLLNAGVRHCDDKFLRQLFFVIVLFLVPAEMIGGIFSALAGYTAIWLVILYLLGAILKKTQLFSKLPLPVLLIGIPVLAYTCYYLNTHFFAIPIFQHELSSGITESYTFPGHILIAIAYVLLCSRFRFGPVLQKIISFAAPGAFAVYIINTQQFVWDAYMFDHFAHWATASPLGILIRVSLTALVFTVVSLIADWLRRQLFRLLKL